MKGTLKNKDSKWIVEFLQKLTNVDTWVKELPLHPEDVKNLEIGFTDKFTKEVEFEIVEKPINYKSPYNKNETFSKFQNFAKLITPKQEETTTSWNEICNLYYNFREENNISHNDVESFEYWLANNYHPPVKK